MGLKRKKDSIELKNSSISKVVLGSLIKKGYKSKGEKVFYNYLRELKKHDKETRPIVALENVVEEVTPYIKLVRKKVGGTFYEIPYFVSEEQQISLGVKSFISGTVNKGKDDVWVRLLNLSKEIESGTGDLLRKKRELHQKGMKNRAYLKFLN